MAVAKSFSLKDCPELFRLLKEGEELADLNKLKTEEILIRWVNYHLMKNGQDRRVNNLGKDLVDSFALSHVLNRLDKGLAPLDHLDGGDGIAKATTVIAQSRAIGVPDLISPEDITSGEEKVLTLYVAFIFNTKHGLEELNEEEYAKCALVDDDIEGSREERAFRLWVNSLGIEGVYIDDLYDGLSNGYNLCKVVDKVDPTVITWKNVDPKPKNYQFGNGSNIKEAITGCKGMGLKMIGIGANEINKKDRKEILATAWSICKTHYLKVIGGKTEKDLVAWANERVGASATPITSLGDKTNLSSGVFWIKLIGTIEARGIDDELVTAGESEDDQKMNAKYAISLARSIGAVVFCVWEDMVSANSKQNLILVSTLYDLAQTYGKEEQA
jgi:plastin-1